MNHRKKIQAMPKAYIYVPGEAKLNIDNVQAGPPTTTYDKRQALLRREDVIKKVTKRRTEPDANPDN